jgi:hypothetical protein
MRIFRHLADGLMAAAISDGWHWRGDASNAGQKYRNQRPDHGLKGRLMRRNGDSDAKQKTYTRR